MLGGLKKPRSKKRDGKLHLGTRWILRRYAGRTIRPELRSVMGNEVQRERK